MERLPGGDDARERLSFEPQVTNVELSLELQVANVEHRGSYLSTWRQQLTPALRSFLCFSFGLGLSISSILVCIGYATSSLGKELGNKQNAILFGSWTLSAVFGWGIFVTRMLGARGAMVAGLVGNTIYACLYGMRTLSLRPASPLNQSIRLPETQVATFIVMELAKSPGVSQLVAFGGAALGGLSCTCVWTSLGPYLRCAAAKHAAFRDDSTEEQANSLLSGCFATLYMTLEVVTNLLSTAVFEGGGGFLGVYILFTTLALVGALVVRLFAERMDNSHEARAHGQPQVSMTDEMLQGAKGTLLLLFSDPRCALMATFNIANGFTAAFMASYVNGFIVKPSLGESAVGSLGAITDVSAAIAGIPLTILAIRIGDAAVCCIGAACFALLGLAFIVWPSADAWTWKSLPFIFILRGLGNCIFEGSNRSLFATFFPKSPQTEAAFSNIILANGSANTLFFVLLGMLQTGESKIFEVAILFAGILGAVGVILAGRWHRRRHRDPTHTNLLHVVDEESGGL